MYNKYTTNMKINKSNKEKIKYQNSINFRRINETLENVKKS